MAFSDEEIKLITAKMVNYVRNGIAIVYAAPGAGIAKALHYQWTAQGERDLSQQLDTLKTRYVLAITKARLDFLNELTCNIRNAGLDPKHWQANAWLAERLHGAGYGKDCEEFQQMQESIQKIMVKLGLAETEVTEDSTHGELDSESDEKQGRTSSSIRGEGGRENPRKQIKKSSKIKKSAGTQRGRTSKNTKKT